MLDDVIQAIESGDLRKAQKLLTKMIKEDKSNPLYWLWMSYVVENRTEKIYCLRMAKKLSPDDARIISALAILGEKDETGQGPTNQQQRRNWESDLEFEALPSRTRFQTFLANPITRLVGMIGALMIVVGLIFWGILGFGSSMFFPQLTITPIAWTDTPTFTPSFTPRVRTSTPTPDAPIPLIELLDATYTPIPLYVNTPHPRIEAYRAAISAYQDHDYERMLSFILQAVREEPESVDIHYYAGLAYLESGDYDSARSFLNQALDLDEEFTPAYLGLARVQQTINPEANIESDIEAALDSDPNYVDAILLLAEYYCLRNEPDQTVVVLTENQEIIGDYAEYYSLLAKAYIDKGYSSAALDAALEANQRDLTSLESYVFLGQAYLMNDQIDEAEEQLNFALRYDHENPDALAALARTQYLIDGDLDSALELLDEAFTLDDENAHSHLYRGLSYFDERDYQGSLNDLYIAKNLLPYSFTANLEFGRALYFLERYNEAYNQLNTTEPIANSPMDLAAVYYWRAQTLDEYGQISEANQNWDQLLVLSESLRLPDEWVETAELRLNPPTSTPTSTRTAVPTVTASPTRTPSSTPTTTQSMNPTSASTMTPSNTPSLTATKTATSTPSPTDEE